jgi:aminopeptidase N
MAHMWFGNLVTPDWWDGLWLNESFATWAGTWAACAFAGNSDPWMRYLMTHEARAYAADESPTTHPISVAIPDVAAAEANFDMITYVKGTSVLRQLVAWVGEEQFVVGLRRYFKRYSWQNADLPALLDELSAASGRDLRAWADDWLCRAGVNTLEVVAPLDAGRYGEVAVVQHGGGGPRPHRIQLGVYDAVPSPVGAVSSVDSAPAMALELRETLELDVTGPRSQVKGLISARPATVLLANDGDLTFAKIRLDAGSRRGLLAGAHTLPTALSRAVAVTTLRTMVLDGELPAPELAAVAMRCVSRETDVAFVGQLLGVAVEAATVYSVDGSRDVALSRVADGCLSAYRTCESEELRRALALGLARSATSEDHLAELAALLTSGDQSFRWLALTRLAALGRCDEDVLGAELARDPGPEAQLRAVAVRAARADAAAKRDALERMLRDRELPVTVLGQLAEATWQAGQEELLRPFALEYLEALPELLADSASAALRNVVGYTFPIFGIDEAFVARARRLEAELEVPPAARNSLRDKLWFAEGVLRARATSTEKE